MKLIRLKSIKIQLDIVDKKQLQRDIKQENHTQTEATLLKIDTIQLQREEHRVKTDTKQPEREAKQI